MAAAIPVGCKFLLGLAAAQILTGTGVDLDALALLDKDRNLNNSTGLNGSGLEYVSSSVALNARLGLSDLELNEQRRLNCENAALVGKNLNVLVLLHEAEIVAQSILADRNLLIGLVVHEVVQVTFIVQILHLAALYESLLELSSRVEGGLSNRTGYDVLHLDTNKSSALARLYMLELNNLLYLTVHFKSYAVTKFTCGHNRYASK